MLTKTCLTGDAHVSSMKAILLAVWTINPEIVCASQFISSKLLPLNRDLVTQEEQDQEDEKSRREAMRDLVESWQDRLQLISVIVRLHLLCSYMRG